MAKSIHVSREIFLGLQKQSIGNLGLCQQSGGGCSLDDRVGRMMVYRSDEFIPSVDLGTHEYEVDQYVV